MFAKIQSALRRSLLVLRLRGIQDEYDTLDWHQACIDQARARLSQRAAHCRSELLNLDHPAAADGCHPF